MLSFLYNDKKTDEANEYIAITKKYNTYKIIQFIKKKVFDSKNA